MFEIYRSRVDWSDEKFLANFDQNKLKKPDEKYWKPRVTSFLNSLYSDTIKKYDSVINLQDLVLMLPHPTKDQLLFHDYFRWHENRVLRPFAETIENGEIIKFLNKIPSSSWLFFRRLIFLSESDVSTDGEFKKMRIIAGMIALICLRSVSKSSNSIKSFLAQNLKSLIHNFYPNIDFPESIPLPTNEFFNDLQLYCDTQKMRDILTFLVRIYTSEKKKNNNYLYSRSNEALIKMLEVSLLNEIRLNGMGVISLLEKVSGKYQISMIRSINIFYPPRKHTEEIREQAKIVNCWPAERREIFKYAHSSEEFPTKMDLEDFYAKYVQPNSKEISWPWARLTNDIYFKIFSIKDDGYTYTANIAAVIALTEPNIWNMVAFKELSIIEKSSAIANAPMYDALLRKKC